MDVENSGKSMWFFVVFFHCKILSFKTIWSFYVFSFNRKPSRKHERYLIGKYAAIHGATTVVKKFKKSHPHLKFGESTARSLRDKYCEISKSSEHTAVLQKMQRGRPLMLVLWTQKLKTLSRF